MAQAAFPSGKIPKKSSFTPRSSAPALPVAAPLGSVDFFERNRCCAGRCPWRLSSEHKPQLEAEGIGRGAATWHGIWHMKLLCKDMQRWSNDQGSTCFNWLVWTQIWTKQTKKHPKPSFWAWDSMIVCGVKCIILLKGQVIHGSNVIDLLDVYILHFVGTLNAHSCNKSGWSWLCFGFGLPCTLWLFNIAIGNWPFIDGLPIRNGDFPWLC